MTKLTNEETEFLKILATDEEKNHEKLKEQLSPKIIEILRQYHKENIFGLPADITTHLKNAGISEDDGKYILAIVRRWGIDIS